MVSKKYYESKVAGKGTCWFCGKKTNFVYDNGKEEFYCDLKCFKTKTPYFRNKDKKFKKLCVKHGKTGYIQLGVGVQ